MRIWRGWHRGSKPPSPKSHSAAARNSAASRRCSRWPACIFGERCDFAVFEAGIGGRYDPVRLVGALVTCVTSVDYEHVELLGNSLELIVSDKSDACAPAAPSSTARIAGSLRPHLLEYNRNRQVASLFVRDQIGNQERSRLGDRAAVRFPVRQS